MNAVLHLNAHDFDVLNPAKVHVGDTVTLAFEALVTSLHGDIIDISEMGRTDGLLGAVEATLLIKKVLPT